MKESLVGKTLAERYTLTAHDREEFLGHVYRATGPDGDLVDVKILHPHLAHSAEGFGRFARETMASEAVSGENTVRLLDHGEEGTLYYLVFEHVDGTLLSEELKAGPLTPERAVGVTIQVAQALTVAHEQNVVHRNLIPDNIVLLRNGGVKVRDFGLSRLLDDRDDDTLTRAGASIGTLAYMAPEYAEDQTVSPAGDAYALGGLMFAMVSGRTPPVMGKMRVPGNVPVWLAELIQQLRTLEAEARPTAADVVSRLERGATNEVQAAPVEEPPAGSLRYVAGIGFVALALFAAAARMLIR